MNTEYTQFILETEQYVQKKVDGNDASHDWDHANRVRKIALKLCKTEGDPNTFIVELAALLHDAEDHKYEKGGLACGKNSNTTSLPTVKEFLKDKCMQYNTPYEEHILAVIDAVSFKNELKGNHNTKVLELNVELESKIVQDADRLDALGAIGIARTFNYAGRIGRPIYSPEEDGDKNIANSTLATFASYTEKTPQQDSTINHFYEKLFHLKNMMKTNTGRAMAEKRHRVMVKFVNTLKAEWELED